MNVLIDNYSGIVINANQTATPVLEEQPPIFTLLSQSFTLPERYARGEVIAPLTGCQIYATVTNASTARVSLFLQRATGATWETLAIASRTGAPYAGLLWFNVPFDEPVEIDPNWLTSTFRITITGSVAISGFEFNSSGLMIRILAATADSGVDMFGNVYRSVVRNKSASSLADPSDFWLSKPNPSQFAVESLYFDQSVDGAPVVIDGLTLDPLTPGIYFHLYSSNDPAGPGSDPASWDALLWTPVVKTFVAHRAATYALPEPVVARFLKVEFSGLQARSYDPGFYQQPMTYSKFPQWVLENALSRFGEGDHDLLASSVAITYDAHDLAYSYHRDDIVHEPDPPLLSLPSATPDLPFVNTESSDGVADSTTLQKISLDFQPFTSHPAQRADPSSLLGSTARLQANATTTGYGVESLQYAVGDTTVVSNLRREALLVEKGLPPMRFYLTCRHTYRVVRASFERNIAYFAGVKQLVFHRHAYTVGYDFDQFNEVLADGQNLAFDYSIPPALRAFPDT